MQAVAKALKDRDLDQFEKVLKEYTDELHTDLLIRTHLALLYDTLLEQNLVRVIEPYSNIELSYVAKEVGQPLSTVEFKWVFARTSPNFRLKDPPPNRFASSPSPPPPYHAFFTSFTLQAQPNDPRQGLPRCSGSRKRSIDRLRRTSRRHNVCDDIGDDQTGWTGRE